MTVFEYLSSLKPGDVVRDKRALYAMKRAGLIWDYSRWGYLECIILHTSDDDSAMIHIFKKGNAVDLEKVPGALEGKTRQGRASVNLTWREVLDLYGSDFGRISYKGMEFRAEYISGCFSPYLVKI